MWVSGFGQPFRTDHHLELHPEIRTLPLTGTSGPLVRLERFHVIRGASRLAPRYRITVPNVSFLGNRIETLGVIFR
ncbi:hypothetical protein MSKU3_3334 [Komagataeibacter oboediens]|nr:hypothetical protein MSKU3_3334 [Komagataeibacter oboediens]